MPGHARDRARLLAGLSLSETLCWGALYYAFTVFVRPMEAELGWSRTATSSAFSIGVLVSGLAAPLAGRAVDRGGARLLMTGGSCLGAAALLAWSRVSSLGGLFAVWLVMGLAMAATLYEPAFAVIAQRFGDHRPRALTVLTLVAGLASTIFLPLAGDLEQRLGWRGALVILALIVGCGAAPLNAFVLRSPAGPGELDAPSAAPTGVVPSRAGFRGLASVFIMAGLATGALGVHLVPYLMERGESAAAAAALAGALGAMQLPGRLAFAPLVSRLPARALLPPIFLLQALGVAVLLVIAGRAGALAFVACFGAGSGLMILARATVVAEVFGAADYGRLAGWLAAYSTAARSLGPLAAGWLYDATGRYDPVLASLALGLTLAAAVSYASRLPVGPAPDLPRALPAGERRFGPLRSVCTRSRQREVVE